MSRSYILVLASVFILFFLQLFATNHPLTLPLSIGLIVLIVGSTLYQLRNKLTR